MSLNINNGARFTTYAHRRPAGSGVIGINGAAARLAQAGDLVIIIAYARMAEAEAKSFTPRVVTVDGQNRPAGRAPPPISASWKPERRNRTMAQRDDSKFSNRLEDAQKARAAMLEKAKARAEEARARLAAGAGDRAAAAAAKEQRQKQKEEESASPPLRAVEEAKAAEEARIKAEAEARIEAARPQGAGTARPHGARGRAEGRPRCEIRGPQGTRQEEALAPFLPSPLAGEGGSPCASALRRTG